MKNLNISTKISVCSYEELNPGEKLLIDQAKEAALRAYAPYSGFHVGASVLLANNEIITGNNQENAAYPSGLCAERTALFYANSRFSDEAVVAVAVAAYTKDDFTDEPVTPCGACRQVILETQNRYKHPVRILLYGKKTVYLIEKISDLLPLSFDAESMTTE
ncbi:MAG: cytidine deaminase [Heliobacteriaceae bacterium]|jgi:cytidine deaminase|nr:cytidine deaminase [Heliobacteriaceae bacterium]